jgi:hypothetical protein
VQEPAHLVLRFCAGMTLKIELIILMLLTMLAVLAAPYFEGITLSALLS